MLSRKNDKHQPLQGESIHGPGDTWSANDIGDNPLTPGTATLKQDTLESVSEHAASFETRTGKSANPSGSSSSQVPRSRTPTTFETGNEATFDSREQTRRLLSKQFFRWLWTALFVVMILITFRIYNGKRSMTSFQKGTYNAIITGLILGLGLNLTVRSTLLYNTKLLSINQFIMGQEAFKDLAKVLRWWILSRRKHNARELDLILDLESFFTVVKLGCESFTKRARLFFCIIWVRFPPLIIFSRPCSRILGIDNMMLTLARFSSFS